MIEREKRSEEKCTSPEALPGSFWGLAAFFNPCRYNIKLANYKRFREASKRQGLNLLCVELAFNNADFQLSTGAADILIQLKTPSVLWQKERLLNIGLEHLPEDCDKIVWLDADIIFDDDDWVKKTSELLELYKVVQPFTIAVRLAKGIHEIDFNKLPQGCEKINRIYSKGGYAWAARRSIFERCGFYDHLILGSGDWITEDAFYGNKKDCLRDFFPKELTIDRNKWMKKIYQNVGGSVCRTGGEIAHLWHGSGKNRLYSSRYSILKEYNFDPLKDIKIDKSGCWIWATDKRGLHKWVNRYFWMRNEEGSFLREIGSICYRFAWNLCKRFPIFPSELKEQSHIGEKDMK